MANERIKKLIDDVMERVEKDDDIMFIQGVLHQKITNENNEKKCGYCFEGVVLSNSKVPKKVFTGRKLIHVDFDDTEAIDREYRKIMIEAVKKKYGLDLLKQYQPHIRTDLISDANCTDHFFSLQNLITSCNDRSTSFRETRNLLYRLMKEWDLENGVRLER